MLDTSDNGSIRIKSSGKDKGNEGNDNRTLTLRLVQGRLPDTLDGWWEWINLVIEEEEGSSVVARKWTDNNGKIRHAYNISVTAAFELMLALDTLLGESLHYEDEE